MLFFFDPSPETETTLPCPPEWIYWLRSSSTIPNCLIPYGSNDLLPDGTQSISMGVFGRDTGEYLLQYVGLPLMATAESFFRDDSSGTTRHDLLCVGHPDACKYWFMSASKAWPEVTQHLRARDGSNTIHAESILLQEPSQVPFDIYFHKQIKGDLIILPPRR